MQSLTGKVTGDTLTATEWNQLPQEVQNVITALGQSLTDSDLNQLGKSIAGYVGAADYFTDSGTANAINLTPPAGLQAPTRFEQGLRIRYRKGTTNTAATTVVLAGLASKKILDETGADLASGDQVAGLQYETWYNSAADGGTGAFIFSKPSAITNELPRNFIDGLILSNGTDAVHDINIAAGACKNSANDADFVLATALGKQIDVVWAEGGTTGTPAGGFPSGLTAGAPVNNTWYRVFAIWRPTGQIDAGFDTSSNAANLLADAVNYTKYRQIGWIRYGVATILAFVQNGDNFMYATPVSLESVTNFIQTAVTITAQAPPSTECIIGGALTVGAAQNTLVWAYYSNLSLADIAPSDIAMTIKTAANSGSYDGYGSFENYKVFLNSSSQLRRRGANSNNVYSTITSAVYGWNDARGKQ